MGTKKPARRARAKRNVWTAAMVVLAAAGIFMLGGCSTQHSMTYEQMRREYDPAADAYNYADDYDDYYYDYMGY